MGCFPSRVDDTNNPPNLPNTNNNATLDDDPASSTAALASSHAQQSVAPDRINRPNKPLKRINLSRHCMPPPHPSITNWTPSLLEQERETFWATRTEGSPRIWGELQRIVGFLRDGDIETAQTFFTANELTCRTGNILDDIFDVHGYKYEIPGWAVMEPATSYHGVNLAEDVRPRTETSGSNDRPEDGDPESAPFQVRCRFPLGKDILITVREQELVSSIIRKIRLKRRDIPQSTPLRVAHLGRVYREIDPLEVNPHWRKGNTLTINVLEDSQAFGSPSSSASVPSAPST